MLEAVPRAAAKLVTESVGIPTIGIGAGPDCDGQVLVCYDFLGLFQGFVPRFVKRYAQLADSVEAAALAYVEEVRAGQFPADEHSFGNARAEPPAPDDVRAAVQVAISRRVMPCSTIAISNDDICSGATRPAVKPATIPRI